MFIYLFTYLLIFFLDEVGFHVAQAYLKLGYILETKLDLLIFHSSPRNIDVHHST